MPHPLPPLAQLSSLYASAASHDYGASQAGSALDGPSTVTFLAHALQCAHAAELAHPDDDELIVAALLHDVGWLLPTPAEGSLLTAASPGTAGSAHAVFIARHDVTGAAFLAHLGLPRRVCDLVAGHVAAKRFLVATEPEYAASLSPGSTWTLSQQGGPMTPAEVASFSSSPDAAACLALRRWDEGAKVPGLVVAPWESHTPRIERVIRSALWAAYGSPSLHPTLSLSAIAPTAPSSPLSASGPGYVVIRDWLTVEEVTRLRAYASVDVPSFPRDSAFHTFERNGSGAVVPSRTEHFAHLDDAGEVGSRFLLDGRLRALCSALREGRSMALYKEKLNYKLQGHTGGYLPHVDFYSKIHPHTLERESLLPDTDVCVCMVAIDDMDEENGAPFVAPGWHTRGALLFQGAVDSLSLGDREHLAGVPVLDPATLPWEAITLRAGDVLIYGNFMPHYSEANASERDRRALFAVYSDARHGELRSLYYAAEARGRRKDGSGREAGKANGFFTGNAVHAPTASA